MAVTQSIIIIHHLWRVGDVASHPVVAWHARPTRPCPAPACTPRARAGQYRCDACQGDTLATRVKTLLQNGTIFLFRMHKN